MHQWVEKGIVDVRYGEMADSRTQPSPLVAFKVFWEYDIYMYKCTCVNGCINLEDC